ncbi:hypothetical protein AB0J83_46410 [Actinoplanes sp. NPDC049596]|uniref:hypothetical protein n=1 Tax=unclassified Actinoplanes TaxID=2626549 RepID=UPI0034124FCE
MNKLARRLAALTTLAAGLTFAAPAAAQADDVEQMCSGWDQSALVADSPSWGRIAQRMCVQWEGEQVRPKVEMRVDWPSGSADQLGAFKRVVLDQYWMDFDYETPSGATDSVQCANDARTFEPFTQDGGAVVTGCVGPWLDSEDGDFWVSGYVTFQRGGTRQDLPAAEWYGVTFS